MTASLRTLKRITVGIQLLLISPAALFMTSLLARRVDAPLNEPARTAQQIVEWYSANLWTLWVLLIALPITVLALGCATLLGSWDEQADPRLAVRRLGGAIRSQPLTMLIAAASLTAGCMLAFVILHMLAN